MNNGSVFGHCDIFPLKSMLTVFTYAYK